jgi:hypothetical protein
MIDVCFNAACVSWTDIDDVQYTGNFIKVFCDLALEAFFAFVLSWSFISSSRILDQ